MLYFLSLPELLFVCCLRLALSSGNSKSFLMRKVYTQRDSKEAPRRKRAREIDSEWEREIERTGTVVVHAGDEFNHLPLQLLLFLLLLLLLLLLLRTRVCTSKTKHVKVSNGNEKKVRLFILYSFQQFRFCRLHLYLTWQREKEWMKRERRDRAGDEDEDKDTGLQASGSALRLSSCRGDIKACYNFQIMQSCAKRVHCGMFRAGNNGGQRKRKKGLRGEADR